VANPVHNSLQGSGHSLLLTGTNMAGKTTFIKSLAVNLLLAQTLGVCLARKAVLPAARLKTLINREDTLLAGQSYFYFEASELRRMLDDAQRNGQEVWFVLDEVFRGTNTIERVAAAAAVLGHLARQGMVLATTHDHELTTLLSAQFDAYHFSEMIDGCQTRFDYRLREGPCTSRNAIKLLAVAGYPKEVIQVAEQLAALADRGLAILPN
jgi:DNA mismatch repair ATPase MutS